ncbi:putative protein kinase RLK-Pelle-LRR-XI-1 family [Dioscorea sansibarensis]
MLLSQLFNFVATTFIFLVFSTTAANLSLPHPLISFLQSLPQPSQRLLLWNNTLPPCQWPGVSCSSTSTTITSINLTSLGLSGQLSSSAPHLCRITTLREIVLSCNNFSGPIPPSLFHCPSLTSLHLGFNSLSGLIPPDVLLATNLTELVLRNNFLSGSIPKQLLLRLPNLQLLNLGTNNLTGPLPDFPPSCSVSKLYLHENMLSGPLPPTLSNCINLTEFCVSSNKLSGIITSDTFVGLRGLQYLFMEYNDFTGELPRSLLGLTGLTQLVLSKNQFNGTIPEGIGQLQSLTRIHLWGNNLTGPIPRSVGALALLNTLVLSTNQLVGLLPPELGNCSSLVDLELQYNLIGGPIPPEISKLKKLEKLYLYVNKLEGIIPPQIGNMTSLVQLQLYNNSLSGRIPEEVVYLRNLRYMSLAFNKLSGEVPRELGRNLSYGLIKLDLIGNDFHGPIPPYLCEGGKLNVLVIGSNRFNGSFPTSIARCSSLWRLILRNNLLHGSIPENMPANPGISYMDLSDNFFDGHIPSVLGSWKNLSMVNISNNLLSGSIPHELGNLKKLGKLWLSANRLNGSIPSELGNCTELLELDLSNNLLSGSIPVEVVVLEKLKNLLLSGNRLSGGIPDSFTPTQNILELQLGGNMLEGSIPSSLGSLQYISTALNLSSNRLNGSIPPSLGQLRGLEVLDLSNNFLSGEIPSRLSDMVALTFVNVSSNQLSGRLPEGWVKFLNSSPGSFSGNPALCIGGNYYCQKEAKEHGHGIHWVIILAMVVLGMIFFLVGVRIATHVAAARAQHGSHHLPSSIRSVDSVADLPEDLTYEDILRATENLSEKYVIGRGKHGTVYRTEFEAGKLWAVKRVDLSQSCFILEMKVLSSVKHRNLVKVAGYCVKDGFGMIIYEYMPGGTLFDTLHDRKTQVALDWETRHRIALGIAQGLSYLHHDCVPQIVHRDMKSNNVLMDSDLEPKIGDFGTAKLLGDAESSSTVSVVVGTLGYIAPGIGYSTKVTEKSDVYSYGVVLLELLCRKLAVDPSFEDGVDIVTWIRSKLENADRCSRLSLLDVEMHYWMEDEKDKALELLDLAISCTKVAFEARPSMREVVGILMKIRGRETKNEAKKKTSF